MNTMNTSNDLHHYGIKGQRWGIRRPIGKNGLVITGKKTGKFIKDHTIDYKKNKYGEKQQSHYDAKNISKMGIKKARKKYDAETIQKASVRYQKENDLKRRAALYGDNKEKAIARNLNRVSTAKIDDINRRLKSLEKFDNQIPKTTSKQQTKPRFGKAVMETMTDVALDAAVDYTVASITGNQYNNNVTKDFTNTMISKTIQSNRKKKIARAILLKGVEEIKKK